MNSIGGPRNLTFPRVRFPHEALQTILEFVGPLDLNSCRGVCRNWRYEVNLRSKVLNMFHVNSLDTVEEGIVKLMTQNPPFEIQHLLLWDGSDFYQISDTFATFLQLISSVTLGKIMIEEDAGNPKFQPDHIQTILKMFPNLFHLEFEAHEDIYRAALDASYLFQTLEGTDAIFPSLQTLIYASHWCRLSTILHGCPNLERLSLSRLVGPFPEDIDGSKLRRLTLGHVDAETLVHLKVLGLTLTHFDVTFREEPKVMVQEEVDEVEAEVEGANGMDVEIEDYETADRNAHVQADVEALVRTFHEFIVTQVSSLECLTLYFDLRTVTKMPLFPLPEKLPGVIKFATALELGDMDDILDSVPAVEDLYFISSLSMWRRARGLSPFLPKTKVLKERSEIDIFEIEHRILHPSELVTLGAAFKNLTFLTMSSVTHGLLHTIFVELTRLTYLKVDEGSMVMEEYALRDSDFIRNTPEGPYIGSMTNLTELCIKFTYDPENEEIDSDLLEEEEEDEDEWPIVPYITDCILTHGIFDIVSQLDRLEITGAQFSQEALTQLSSLMTPNSDYPKQRDHLCFVK